jgi:uncharacterized protein (DUF433 family)
MSIEIMAEMPPLRVDPDGSVRIGKTRLLMEAVIEAHLAGHPPEEIVRMFDVVSVAEVYAVIAFYLRHREEVDRYLEECEREADEIWAKINARQGDSKEWRATLLARWAARYPDQPPPDV